MEEIRAEDRSKPREPSNESPVAPWPLRPEDEVFYWTARPVMVQGSAALCRSILREHERDFDWGRLFDLGARHKVLQMIAHAFFTNTLGPISQSHHFVLQSAYLGNWHRNFALRRELRQVLSVLNQRGIRAVLRKGAVLTELAYEDPGIRYRVDSDFFIPQGSVTAFTAALFALGYSMGIDSADRRTVSPLPRETELQWKLQIGSLPPFLRPSSDPYIDMFVVDARRRMMEPASGKVVPTDELVDRAEQCRIAGERALTLAPEDFLIDLSTHVHREAILLQAIAAGKDLSVYRFLDIDAFLRLAGSRLSPDGVAQLVHRYDIQRETYFGLHFANEYLGGAVDPRLLDAIRPSDLSYLEEYGELDRQIGRWPMPFFERLFDARRSLVVTGTSRLAQARGRRGGTQN